MTSNGEIVLRLLLGAVFGGVIGYERQAHGRPAGFRTQMLVCIASVLIMEVSEYYHYMSTVDPSYVRIDPGRIAAGAITGVGFLGAGVIVKTGATVQGLTTAACIWMVSAIGLAVGGGLYAASTVAFGLTLFSLIVLRAVEARTAKLIFKSISVSASDTVEEGRLLEVLKTNRAIIQSSDFDRDVQAAEVTYRYTIAVKNSVPLGGIVDGLSSIDGVRKISVRT